MEKTKTLLVYRKKGQVQQNVISVIALIVGVGVATLVLIFVGVLGGQVYSQVEPDINAINDTNIQSYIKDAITSGFKSLGVSGKYLPIIVMASFMFIALGLIFVHFRPTFGYGGYGGTAL